MLHISFIIIFRIPLVPLTSNLSFQSDFLPSSHLELIPYAPYGEDVFGVGWVFFYRFADAVDVYGDGGGVAQGFHAPDAVVQGVTAEYDACVDHEKMKQLKLLILSLIHISEPTRLVHSSRMPSSA